MSQKLSPFPPPLARLASGFPLSPDSKGFSPLVILFLVVLGAFILWELNESISFYNLDLQNRPQNITATKPEPVCLTGEADDCNDSNDVFLLPD